jgi:hypothetical protein
VTFAYWIAAIGRGVADERAPAEIAVVLDGSLTDPTPDDPYARVRCSAGAPLDICSWSEVGVSLQRHDLSWEMQVGDSGIGGQAVHVEILPADVPTFARLFAMEGNDHLGFHAACVSFEPRATSGTLRLSTTDLASGDVHGVLDAELEGGHSVVIEF